MKNYIEQIADFFSAQELPVAFYVIVAHFSKYMVKYCTNTIGPLINRFKQDQGRNGLSWSAAWKGGQSTVCGV